MGNNLCRVITGLLAMVATTLLVPGGATFLSFLDILGYVGNVSFFYEFIFFCLVFLPSQNITYT